ncbi:hypothetical protein ACQUJS_09675 [Ralstonia pseudosolanacearum]|uniref:Putative type III effector, HopAA1 family n=1 Tax=Ralstonia solanacearum TaxID=305 RepID=A0A0S4TYX5_RALSL|nr:membrane protein [Ralstonia solanacearum]CUV14737.1 putative type III effector, HopAA1 family [Ralstonia solanacearum]
MRTSLDRASGLAPIPAHPQESTGHAPAKEHPPAGRAPVRASSDLASLSTLSAQSSQRSSARLSISVSSRQPETDAPGHGIETSPPLSPRSWTASPDALLTGHSQRSESNLSQLRRAPSSMQVSSIRSGASGSLGGNSPPPPLPPTVTVPPAPDSHGVDIPNRMQIAEQLRDIFRPRFNGINDAQFEALIQPIAERFDEMGETPASIAETLTKGFHRDRLAQIMVGFLRSVPFGFASRLFDVKQALTAFAKTPARIGAVVGAGSGVADAFGGSLLARATGNTQWLAASVEHLEPVMAQSHEAMQPSLSRLAVEVSAAFQAYSLRNVIRTGAAPLATHLLGAATAANVDSWIAAVGGPVAGAAAYMAMQHMNETQHRTGAEYLLGRTDWEAQFRLLKESAWSDPLKGVANRAATLSADILTETLAATRSLFTATNVIKNAGALAGGFAGVLTAQTAVGRMATNAGASEAAIATIKRAVGTVLSAPVYAAWTTADVMAGPTLDAAARRIRQAFAPQPQAAAPAHAAIDIV